MHFSGSTPACTIQGIELCTSGANFWHHSNCRNADRWGCWVLDLYRSDIDDLSSGIYIMQLDRKTQAHIRSGPQLESPQPVQLVTNAQRTWQNHWRDRGFSKSPHFLPFNKEYQSSHLITLGYIHMTVRRKKKTVKKRKGSPFFMVFFSQLPF